MGCKRLGTDFLFFLEVETSEERARTQKKDLNVYPFGLKHKGYNNVVSSTNIGQKFTFNGQQFDESLNLNVQEMTFRQYDPAIGRFSSIDVMCESAYMWTPYRFGFNNPIYWKDPLGLFENGGNQLTDYYDMNGTVFFDPNVGPNNLPSGATYIGPTYINPVTRTFWDENMIPHFQQQELAPVTVTAKKNNSGNYFSILNISNDFRNELGNQLWNSQNKGGSFRIFKNTNQNLFGKQWAPKYYPDNRFGSGAASKHPVYNVSKVLKKGTVAITVVLGTVEVGQGVVQDYQNYQQTGYTNGQNTAVAGTSVVTGAAVGYGVGVGATWLTGALAGAAGGSIAPGIGTAIGFVVGGVAGYYASEHAGNLVKQAYEE